jgi:DNA repair protein RadA/Sms
MILAFREKRAGLGLAPKMFLNVTGGISVDDPAIDLWLLRLYYRRMKILQVNKDFVLLAKSDFQRNRPVNQVDQHTRRGRKLAFQPFCIKYNKIAIKQWNKYSFGHKIEDVMRCWVKKTFSYLTL